METITTLEDVRRFAMHPETLYVKLKPFEQRVQENIENDGGQDA